MLFDTHFRQIKKGAVYLLHPGTADAGTGLSTPSAVGNIHQFLNLAAPVFDQLWFWDPKETWSFITWLIFMAYLHARYTLDWRGKRAAILAIVGFAAVVFTYVGVDFLLPQIHGTKG